eukprot:4940695-Amphidinium_carterae.1
MNLQAPTYTSRQAAHSQVTPWTQTVGSAQPEATAASAPTTGSPALRDLLGTDVIVSTGPPADRRRKQQNQ